MNEFEDMSLSEPLESESRSSSAAEKIPEYVPTNWVDETEPDIDADHLNHIEDGIKKATDGINSIIENGGGSFVPSDGYVYIDQQESEENPEPVDVPMLDAETLGGQPPSYYAPQHEISDAFLEDKAYAVGDYCIYLNSLYKFIATKAAGAWDGSKVVPVSVSGELAALNIHTKDVLVVRHITTITGGDDNAIIIDFSSLDPGFYIINFYSSNTHFYDYTAFVGNGGPDDVTITVPNYSSYSSKQYIRSIVNKVVEFAVNGWNSDAYIYKMFF